MKTKKATLSALFALALITSLFADTGCGHKTVQSKIPVTQTQAPVVSRTRSVPDSKEKQLQDQIGSMQDQIGILTARAESLASFHGSRMGPQWNEKVQDARTGASHLDERMRYLEATKALLARKLGALRSEIKVYEDFELSDPAVPRP